MDNFQPMVNTQVMGENTEVTNGNMFSNMAATPIRVSRNESSGLVDFSGFTATSTSSVASTLAKLNIFQNLPKETSKGVDGLSRMKMSVQSNLPEEIKWGLKKYLAYSNKAPYLISLKDMPDLLPIFKAFIQSMVPIVDNFDKPITINAKDEVSNADPLTVLQFGLNSLLILRNLAQDTDSVQVLVKDSSIKEFILFILTKYETLFINKDTEKQIYHSNVSFANELIHYVLDIMEAVSSYMAPAKLDDPFFKSLITLLNYTKDRYLVISILRSLSRLLVRSKSDELSAAENLDEKSLSAIVSFLLIDCDIELVTASLDFLYQYILPGNERISKLINDPIRMTQLSAILPKLLTSNIPLPNYEQIDNHEIRLIKRLKPAPPKDAPPIDDKLFNELIAIQEPLRSIMWLRCCFEPINEAEVTQITLWRTYEAKFSLAVREKTGKKLLPAVEFIKNVSNAFSNASAMVITDPATSKKRFVIKGIQPRFTSLSLREAEEEHAKRITNSSSDIKKSVNNNITEEDDTIKPVEQNVLPELVFPQKLSDISNATATFLCLLSNDTKGHGLQFCQSIKPLIIHKLVNVPPLTTALSEYMENTKLL
ncbi:hypothetical protein TPHA_0C04880 [Tetrapisispora phaffii CBS 4417]|uniref:RFX-type winged-helix domain-containing protein n=1 Tax=Tetrapisispora phaffii (strain ATCC 24235 / CBS 4417 / NBRC 1672 / NRRL Y-8282 / UCD 70-5) TaxID=1071381 RepID=G8BQX4_TETPH|nr:hypothetical protein TPHA_0C04880 [Tetrapisispora phaffii CBS 4417]CCE62636.1 hypothetical protein TPHA_0C04880 [Tetrapisispora phaffii CBS 4417]